MKTYLEERIEWYDENYRQGNALISDKQFDQLEQNLQRIDPNCDYFISKNNLILPSLSKGNYREFLEGLLNKTRLIVEPKIDGCAIGLQYQDGVLTKAISRKGSDITNKMRAVPDIPTTIKIGGLFQVRGELFNPSEYERPSYSQRQASAYLRAADSKSDHLSFCCYQILNGRINQYESLKYLKKLGFTIPDFKTCNYTSMVETYRKNWLDKKLFSNYLTDGIVIKINSRKAQLIRENNKYSNDFWQYAIKE